MATPRGKYPHWKRAGDFILVSGISSRRPDNTFEGVTTDVAGATVPDIRAQTRAVILNIRKILESAGAGLEDLVQVTCFLQDRARHAAFHFHPGDEGVDEVGARGVLEFGERQDCRRQRRCRGRSRCLVPAAHLKLVTFGLCMECPIPPG